jgi:adenylate cyclase
MGLIKPINVLRRKSHVDTRLQLRDERTFARIVLPKIAVVYVGFGFVDWYSASSGDPVEFFGVRLAAVLISRVLYLLSRGRLKYGMRFMLLFSPYVFAVEYIMIKYGLVLSPYFAGLALVMLSGTMYFPVRMAIAAMVYGASILPALIWVSIHPTESVTGTMNFFLMTIGSVVLCTVNSEQIYRDFRERLILMETLARDLGRREKEIRAKADQLFKRQAFESQFSPQVVSAVLNDRASLKEMLQRNVVTVVVDIENSTLKAKTLVPTEYKNVIEEVFDVFASACLKWNITVDKFTGDGAQAFAGAPVTSTDDMFRALMASKDTLKMLRARQFSMEPRWKSPVVVRIAVCEGKALVGFLGRGTLKSFTAIGETVSFAHRLCGAAEPDSIAVYSLIHPGSIEMINIGFSAETKILSNLKGFGDQSFRVTMLRPMEEETVDADNGRCGDCQTPLVLEDSVSGLPRIVCPGCQSRRLQAA